MQVIFTLWDDSPIVIETDMIVDYRPNWSDGERCTIQTVRDTWPVKESFEEIVKAFNAMGIRPRQIKLLISEHKGKEKK